MKPKAKLVEHSILEIETPWMSASEAAEYLRLPSSQALYQRIRRGTVPYYKDGSRYLFRRDELDQLPQKGLSMQDLEDGIF